MTAPQYVIRITADVSWEGRENGLPESLHAFVLFSGDNSPNDVPTINKIIEEQMNWFIRSQMMFVQRDQGQIIDIHLTPQDRMAVPFRWLTKFYATVDKLTAELSLADDDGIERLEDGSEPLKN